MYQANNYSAYNTTSDSTDIGSGSILDQFKLPLCNQQFGLPLYPFFQPMLIDTPQENEKGK